MGLPPGHANSSDVVYRTFDPVGTALRCFRCHSTGPVKLDDAYTIEPSEPGIHCGSCHGNAVRRTALGSRGCIDCHMPQVATGPGLHFTKHWIGIYD